MEVWGRPVDWALINYGPVLLHFRSDDSQSKRESKKKTEDIKYGTKSSTDYKTWTHRWTKMNGQLLLIWLCFFIAPRFWARQPSSKPRATRRGSSRRAQASTSCARVHRFLRIEGWFEKTPDTRKKCRIVACWGTCLAHIVYWGKLFEDRVS